MRIIWPNARAGAPGYPHVIVIGGAITQPMISGQPAAVPATYTIERHRGRWVPLPDIPPPLFLHPNVRDYLVELGFYLKALEKRSVVLANHEGTVTNAMVPESAVTQHEGAIDHDALTNYVAGQHRVINDSGTSATELWSASKINTQLGGKADTSHTHSASDITSGVLTDARLPAEVPLTDEANSFTATQTFSGVDINGGNIDGTVVGGTTPANGFFSDLSSGGDLWHSYSLGSVGFFGVGPIGQRATVADASTSHSVTGSDTVDQASVELALDTLGSKINSVLATLEAYGLHNTV